MRRLFRLRISGRVCWLFRICRRILTYALRVFPVRGQFDLFPSLPYSLVGAGRVFGARAGSPVGYQDFAIEAREREEIFSLIEALASSGGRFEIYFIYQPLTRWLS